MAIARTVLALLQERKIPYTVIPHPHSATSRETAEEAHVAAGQLAKAVVLMDERGYVMVVLPADRHLALGSISRKLGRDLKLAGESRVLPVFGDCAPGAIPPLGPAYGMETIVDDSLVGLPEIFFEAGDHEDLIRIGGEEFLRLLSGARHGSFTH